MITKTKICGITNMEDAIVAVEAGADALGFVFHRPSPRFVDPATACAIVRALPPFVTRVGVFVDSPLQYIRDVMADCALDFAQLHGSEQDDFCVALAPRVIKSVRVGRDDVLASLVRFQAAAFVLDTYHPSAAGGTGESFDWQIGRTASETGKRIILSGGLRPENVAEAIRVARPYAVDVASGVEATPGIKDHSKLRDFLRNARAATRAAGTL